MSRTEELTVITKTYDLILWSCHHTSRFPRNYRFVLGERRPASTLRQALFLLCRNSQVVLVTPCEADLGAKFRPSSRVGLGSSSAKSTSDPAGLVGRKARTPCRVC